MQLSPNLDSYMDKNCFNWLHRNY